MEKRAKALRRSPLTKSSLGGRANRQSAASREVCSAVTHPGNGARGSRARASRAKATDAVKPEEAPPSRTLRRRGRGMQGQSFTERERPASVRATASREGVGAGQSAVCRRETTQLPSREGPAAGPCNERRTVWCVSKRLIPPKTERSGSHRSSTQPRRAIRSAASDRKSVV